MYSVADHASMLADAVRMDGYSAALRHAVHSDTVVADLGSGLGTFALLAARAGARRVYAIEPDDVIHVARAIASASGLADRIEFIQARSTDVELPHRANVIVSDMRGVLPFFGRHIPAVVDARARLLAPGGVLIPRRDSMHAAIVEAPDLYASRVCPWGAAAHGLDLAPLRHMLSNTWFRAAVTPAQVLSRPACLSTLDYRTNESPDFDVEMIATIERDGTAHGISVWFDCELADEVGFSNAPGAAGSIHGQAFFPFGLPLEMRARDEMAVTLRANLVSDDYLWRWTCAFRRASPGQTWTEARSYSSLDAVPLGSRMLLKGASDYVPVLADEGEIDLFILTRMRASVPLGEIARELLATFPSQLPDWNAALGRAGELARKYSKT